MIAKLPVPTENTVCDLRYGWLSADFDSRVRQIVINNINNILKQYHRENASKPNTESNKNSVSFLEYRCNSVGIHNILLFQDVEMDDDEPVCEDSFYEYGSDINAEEISYEEESELM